MKIDKEIHIINKGYVTTRELYQPNCDVSRMIFGFLHGNKKRANMIFEDIVALRNHGWEIFYSGKKSRNLGLLNATYEE